MIIIENVEAAIVSAEASRATHLDWGQWFELHPEEEKRYEKIIHNAKEQKQIVAEYDNIIACLHELRSRI